MQTCTCAITGPAGCKRLVHRQTVSQFCYEPSTRGPVTPDGNSPPGTPTTNTPPPDHQPPDRPTR